MEVIMQKALVPNWDEFGSQNSKYWIDRPLWGNRFYPDQSPELIILEFLMILLYYKGEAEDNSSDRSPPFIPVISGEKHPSVEIDVYVLNKTRKFIYGEPYLDIILNESESKGEVLKKLCEQIPLDEKKSEEQDWAKHLMDHMNKEELKSLIEYFRDATFDSGAKRWSSCFLFPYGKNCIYPDFGVKKNKKEKSDQTNLDRRFFGRGGELLFHMFSRAKFEDNQKQYTGKDVLDRIYERFFGHHHPIDSLFLKLRNVFKEGGGNGDKKSITAGYLPFKSLPNYDSLAKDIWILLDKPLSIEVFFEHFKSIIALHFIRYYLDQAQRVLSGQISYAKDSDYIWDLKERYNEGYSIKDKQPLLQYSHENNDNQNEVLFVCAAPQNNETILVKYIKDLYENYARLGAEAVAKLELDRMKMMNFLDEAAARDERHQLIRNHHHKDSTFKQAYISWLSKVGLATPSRGKRHFIVSNQLARTLVVLIVDEPMEYETFLIQLAKRFGIVISPSAAKFVGISPTRVDFPALNRNAIMFSESLRSIGLLKSLSDDCSYVINPYYVKK